MLRNIFCLTAIAACAACATSRSATMSNDPSEKNKQNIRRLYEEGINQRRSDLFPELIAADYTGPQGETGPAGYGASVDSVRAGFPDVQFTIDDLVAEGDRVAVRWRWSGRHTGTFRGMAPTQTQITNSGIAIYQLRDGKAIRSWLEVDRLGVLQQVGAVPKDIGRPTK